MNCPSGPSLMRRAGRPPLHAGRVRYPHTSSLPLRILSVSSVILKNSKLSHYRLTRRGWGREKARLHC